MLSILPFERSAVSSQRDSERPFKAYPRVPLSSSLSSSSFYSPFAAPPASFHGVSSYFPSHSSGLGSTSGLGHKTHSSADYPTSASAAAAAAAAAAMDLRGPPHMDGMPSLIDISQSTPNGGPPVPPHLEHGSHHSRSMGMGMPPLSIKQEQHQTSMGAAPQHMYHHTSHVSQPHMGHQAPLLQPQPPPERPHQTPPTPPTPHHLQPDLSQHQHHHQPQQQQQQQQQQQHCSQRAASTGPADQPIGASQSPSPPLHQQAGGEPGNGHDSFRMPPKKRPHSVPDGLKDANYWDKRKKNNDSAKRSRDARRMKEEQIAMRVVYLEQENLQLRTEVSLLKSEIEKLRCMLYNS